MPTTQLHQTITATPEHILAGITDVGPGRSQLFPNSADDQLEVYDTTEPGEPHAILSFAREGGVPPSRLRRLLRTSSSGVTCR